jgi:alpha-glucosidase
LRDDPLTDEPFGLPLLEHELGRDLRYSRNAERIGEALGAIRDAADEALLIGEIYLPARKHAHYLEHLDRSFVFELIQSPWEPAQLRAAIAAGAALEGRGGPGAAWALSNHDFGRFPTRLGRAHERAAALMLMTLPGTATLYQGDEIGQGMGPGGDPPYDRVGRDVFRHPMQWDSTGRGGFSAAEPWLPVVDAAERNVADQRKDPGSLMNFWRELIALRRDLGPGFRMLEGQPGVILYARGDVLVAINAGTEPAVVPAGEVLLATSAAAARGRKLAPGDGALLSAS